MRRIELVYVPACPLVDRVRAVVRECLEDAGIDAVVHEREGAYPSPTLLVDGADVITGKPIAASCRRRALCGWSPPSQPADTAAKRFIDGVLTRSGAWCAVVTAVVVAFNVAAHLPTRGALALDGLAALLAGGMCGANFWRCRHAHCLITGAGWLPLSVVAFAGAVTGHSLVDGWEQTAFTGTLVLSLVFEIFWYLARGTNALTLRGGVSQRG
jgi:hypothetical protein